MFLDSERLIGRKARGSPNGGNRLQVPDIYYLSKAAGGNKPVIFFSSLIAIIRTSRTMLNNSSESGHPCLVPDLRGGCFQFFTIENNLCCKFIIYGLYYVEVGSFYSHFLKSFNHKWVLNFVKGLFCIY